MKKNKMMRLASALLVAVMLSTSVISGTYAKYVTSDSANDTARVADWGVTIVTEGEDTFKDVYGTTVESKLSLDDVVAPGTDNTTGVSFKLSGTPEVSTKLEVIVQGESSASEATDVFLGIGTYANTTTGDDTDWFEVTTNDYHPLVFTLKNGADQVLVSGSLSKIEAYLESMSKTYDPLTNLATEVTPTGGSASPDGIYKLTWAWAFGDAEGVTRMDKEDTLLGNLAVYPTNNYGVVDKADPTTWTAVSTDKYSTKVSFSITIRATQVD